MHTWALGLSCETPAAPPDLEKKGGQKGWFFRRAVDIFSRRSEHLSWAVS